MRLIDDSSSATPALALADAGPVLRVLLACGHPLLRAGLRTVIEAVDDLAVAAETGSSAEAARLAGRLRPRVVVFGLEPRDAPQQADLARLVAATPEARVLVVAADARRERVLGAVRAGARGYLLDSAAASDLVLAIRSVGRGDAAFGAEAADAVLAHLRTAERAAEHPFGDLTERERDVLALLAEGASTGQIALRLQLRAKTVRNHVSSICAKQQVGDRVQAVLRAREAGLGV
jgi:DNA-binding NarL/FixJ family response regulator